jgi:signal transduction histidine kinase
MRRTWPFAALIAAGGAGLIAGAASEGFLRAFEVRHIAFPLALPLPLYATGVYAYWKRPDLPMARLLLAIGSLWALTWGLEDLVKGISESYDSASWAAVFPVTLAIGITIAATAIFFAVFPSGRVERHYERWLVRLVELTVVGPALLLLSDSTLSLGESGDRLDVSNPVALGSLEWLKPPAEAMAGLPFFIGFFLFVTRYVRGDAERRRQMRWLLAVPLAALLYEPLNALLLSGLESETLDTVGAAAEYVLLALVPLTIMIAILRHRLLDVDLLLRRSLVYGALWVAIAAIYVGVAAAFGIAAGERLPVALAVLLTVFATLLFQPARQRLERLADRWVFGERLSGYELLARFGATLEETFDPGELCQRLAEAVRRGMRVRWARVLVQRPAGGRQLLDPQAAVGIPREADVQPAASVPMAHAGEPVGVIEVGPKEDGDLTAADHELLATLARQAAIAIRNANLASELSVRLEEISRQAEELTASRARIVQAQDAERRRIERNIHDGVQQELVALIAKLRLARNQLGRDPGIAYGTLAELQDEAGHVLEDLRELARGIHPSVLSDRGLVEAIEARAARLPLHLRVEAAAEARAGRFTPAIEGAAYFAISEALANALKHANATHVDVKVAVEGERLVVEVRDDGAGFEPSDVAGSGLENLRDRMEALGGRLIVASRPGHGTRITARLPARRPEPVRA